MIQKPLNDKSINRKHYVKLEPQDKGKIIIARYVDTWIDNGEKRKYFFEDDENIYLINKKLSWKMLELEKVKDLYTES
jgi:hypothetical protein